MFRDPVNSTCSSIFCQKKGTLKCTRCREATPPTLYCSRNCQKDDWMFHKAYCGKKAYTFDLTLVGTSNPVIKRTFDVPAWFTFRQLHYTLQYAMGPWDCTHMHEFSFNKWLKPGPRKQTSFLIETDEKLKIGPKTLYGEDEDELDTPGMPRPRRRLYSVVAPQGEVYPLIYVYDFGDNWEHELIFKGQKFARADRPLFSAAEGCGPVEDCGGPTGWNSLKAAFRKPAESRSSQQKETVAWAKKFSGLGQEFSPFKEPDVTQMNYEGRWENHVEHYMTMSGEPLPERPGDSDEYDMEDD